MSPFQGYRGDGVLAGVRSRKRVFATAAAEPVTAAAKRQKRRDEPSLDAVPDECLFEVLRRVQGTRARCASACVSRRWLALLAGIRASEAVLAPAAPAVPDLNQEYLSEDDEADLMDHDGDARERTLEGMLATDARLTAAAVAGRLASVSVRGSHPARGVTDAGVCALARGCPELRSLTLWDVPQVTDAGLAEIAAECHSLERLDITGCPMITDKGLVAVAQGCPELKSLTIEACSGVANEGLKAIGRCCAKLQAVSVKNCAHVDDQGVSGLVCSATASLAKVRLQGLNITDASLAVIGYYGKSIKDLTLARLPAVGERGFWVMANALGLQKLRCMTVVSCPGLTDLALASVAKFSPSLKTVNLKKCSKVSDGCLKEFAESSRVLESLQIEECSKVTLVGILAFLLNCNPKFKALSLSKCIGIKDICSAPAQLPVCKSLRSLTIKDCPGFTDASLAVVGMICPQLESIDLSGLGAVTDNGFLPLMKKGSESGLVRVGLNGCESLTDAAVSALAKAHGASLAHLSLEGCSKITDASLFAISESCSQLAELDLSNCMVSDYGVAVLAAARQLKLRVLSLSGCMKVTQKSVPFLGSMSSSLEALNLQFNFIGNHNIASLEKQLWRCDILA
uniref:F-box/LRR-repeat protein 15-like leucin rich repeat domain-containing protein n=2 Tax=Zea mays TaxID=4577 RepID=A0A804UJA1_MAIZE